ncbi:MAG: RsmB/NOP family class I SAM-dependent RNA methyltransferase [Clostridiales bacterium]|nr:RsmB/NOP family class I SAM-dependent RNA methyltransferase [Clostridiales bacterium]
MKDELGHDFPAYLAAMDRTPAPSLRINTAKTDSHGLEYLAGAALVPNGVCPEGFFVPPELSSGRHPLHAAGLYYLQEASAQLPAELLEVEPGMNVLDLCAAPGGKSTQIAGKLQGSGVLVANEVSASRAKVLLGNIERLGITNAVVTQMEPEALARALPEAFDRVLVDAPCSGEGMFRKDPAAIAHWSPAQVCACARRQSKILSAAARTLKSGGRLVYATCTFSREENEDVVENFLRERTDFSLVTTHRLYPHTSPGEGQFAAVLERRDCGDGSMRAIDNRPYAAATQRTVPTATPLSLEDACPVYSRFSEENLILPPDLHITYLPDGRVLAAPPLPFSLAGLRLLRAGVLQGEARGDRFVPAHALALMARETPFARKAEVDLDGARAYLQGETLPTNLPTGWCAVAYQGRALGLGKVANGVVKNHYPKGLRM